MIHKVIVPKNRKVSLSFTVPEDYVGEEMEVIAFMRKEGLLQTEPAGLVSPALQGGPLTNKEFINWINQAETMPTVSLEAAKNKWTNKRTQLQRLIK
ncbi:MAG TPA: hypothetical protein VIM16_02550 [Mucilaginibacter sp.]|jgi:hypothetical protein